MSKRKLAVSCVFVILAALLNVFIIKYVTVDPVWERSAELHMQTKADFSDTFQVFYSDNGGFSESQIAEYKYEKISETADAEYIVKPLGYIRIDFGTSEGTVELSEIEVGLFGKTIDITDLFCDSDNIVAMNDINQVLLNDSGNGIVIKTEAGDPYVAFCIDMEGVYAAFEGIVDKRSLVIDIVLCVILDLLVIMAIRKLGTDIELPQEVSKNRKLIVSLSKNDFKTRFAGSYLGTIWAFIQPIVTVVVYWFVFEVGLRSGRVSQYPFILWLMAGLVPWFFFSEAWGGGTNALIEYNYLVKKVVFKISILPIVKVVSALFTHLFFTVFVLILCWCYGYQPGLYTLQLIYYIFCSFVLVLGLSYLTSAVVCFFKDLTQIINIVLQIGIWMTPIMWNTDILPYKWRTVFKLNPVYYIVDGFRDTLLAHVWISDKLLWTCYFWLLVICIFALGTSVFKKLKVHFADVL